MKKNIISSSIILIIGLTAFAQTETFKEWGYRIEYDPAPSFSKDLRFSVHGRYSRPAKKQKLVEARLLGDFIPGYPTNWISNYTSVEIMVKSNGIVRKAASKNDTLSKEQKNILNTASIGTEIIIKIMDKYFNPEADIIADRKINISMMIIPEIEAQYIGGYQKLSTYLRENAIKKIYENYPKRFQQGIVNFTINENGEIENAKISTSSGDASTDKLLIDTINKMPKWKPAENSNGIKVKQDFEFTVGNDGC